MMKKTLICNSLKVSELSSKDIDAMFNLFCKYYSNVSKEQFNIDLSEKDYLFLLKDKATLAIKGFSTIVEFNIDKNGKASRGYFSGDTVIDKEYWGQGALGKAFLKFLFIQKLKKPFTPLYWFLISKGYKTYLMMANNFKTHYPRFEKETPSHLREIINTFSEELYG